MMKILLVLAAFSLVVAGLADDPKQCFNQFSQLENEFEEQSDALVDYVNEHTRCPSRDCVRKDPKVRKEVDELVEKLKLIGAMRGCAQGYESKRDIKRSVRNHLQEYIDGVEEALTEIETERTMHLFQFILDKLKRTTRWMW